MDKRAVGNRRKSNKAQLARLEYGKSVVKSFWERLLTEQELPNTVVAPNFPHVSEVGEQEIALLGFSPTEADQLFPLEPKKAQIALASLLIKHYLPDIFEQSVPIAAALETQNIFFMIMRYFDRQWWVRIESQDVIAVRAYFRSLGSYINLRTEILFHLSAGDSENSKFTARLKGYFDALTDQKANWAEAETGNILVELRKLIDSDGQRTANLSGSPKIITYLGK